MNGFAPNRQSEMGWLAVWTRQSRARNRRGSGPFICVCVVGLIVCQNLPNPPFWRRLVDPVVAVRFVMLFIAIGRHSSDNKRTHFRKRLHQVPPNEF